MRKIRKDVILNFLISVSAMTTKKFEMSSQQLRGSNIFPATTPRILGRNPDDIDVAVNKAVYH